VIALRLTVVRAGKSRGVERLTENIERSLDAGVERGPKAIVEAEIARELEALAVEDDDPGDRTAFRRTRARGCEARARDGRRQNGEREDARPDGARAISGGEG
jgi:hypothetical protein